MKKKINITWLSRLIIEIPGITNEERELVEFDTQKTYWKPESYSK